MLFNLFFILAITLTNACQLECPMNWDPVCGTDGKTYGNLCELQSISCQKGKEVDVLSKGECQQQYNADQEAPVLEQMSAIINQIKELELMVKNKDIELELMVKNKDIELMELKSELGNLKTEVKSDLGNMRSLYDSQENEIHAITGGATYIRWGRLVCPVDTELVYRGFAGGTLASESGNGANYLCLPEIPTWNDYNEVIDISLRGKIQGAEYETVESFPFNETNLPTDVHLQNNNVPCAVCYNTLRSSSLMVPGSDVCEIGWTKEYSGYLASGRYNYKMYEYICIDEAPEILPGGGADTNGATIYPVDAECGNALPCPPYFEGREVTCAVCTR